MFLILTPAQAAAVYAIAQAANNVSAEFDIRMAGENMLAGIDEGTVRVSRTNAGRIEVQQGIDWETHDSQAVFANTYGLDG